MSPVEPAPEYPRGTRYAVTQYPGVAFWIDGWETEADEDTEWTGIRNRTGMLLCVMVGDNYRHRIDPADLAEIADEAYCAGCGQIGCTADGR